MYITSSDDHDVHDVFMLTYIGAHPIFSPVRLQQLRITWLIMIVVLNIPWMVGGIYCTPKENVASLRRRLVLLSELYYGNLFAIRSRR